ncbi:MAG: hypothetical protein N2Z69_02155, partial [Methylophilaceae bacterium]|nr:hypothetical protein [Methylophilaceae bacterium]
MFVGEQVGLDGATRFHRGGEEQGSGRRNFTKGRASRGFSRCPDITARRELEERERRQLEALARQARLSSFAEIASALAHQLNQPLAAIASYNAGVLHMLQAQGYHDPVVLQALQRQGEQTREAGRIVQRMRDFLTRRQPRREPVHLEQVIRQALGLLRHACQRQGVSVELRITPDLPHVLGDEVLLEQVLI